MSGRKVCVITGTRAEYGLLKNLLRKINQSETLELQLIVTGTHLSPNHGFTVEEIEGDGFRIDKKVEMLLSADTPSAISKSMGIGMIGFADAVKDLKPDLIVLLGDRFETFVAATSSMIAGIPICHIHGGETTFGLVDEAIRHSITKMSHIHFVAAKVYKDRVVQLGEQPDSVHIVGGLGLDNIEQASPKSKNDLSALLGIKFYKKNLLVTFHPVTLEQGKALEHIEELLEALSSFNDTGLFFTLPNADSEGKLISSKIIEFCMNRQYAKYFSSLGNENYLALMQQVDGVVGNSSSGLIEAPSLKVATLNIGSRQKGRLRATSVIDCKPERDDIEKKLALLLSTQFKSRAKLTQNPYGQAGASTLIKQKLEEIKFDGLLQKHFYDLLVK